MVQTPNKTGMSIANMAVLLFELLIVLLLGLTPAVLAGEVEQIFPADKPGAPKKTTWKVSWGLTHPGILPTRPSNVLYIQKAEFRGEDGEWVTVLRDARLSEILVPYHNGQDIFDISGQSFNLIEAKSEYLSSQVVVPGQIFDKFVIKEVLGDGNRWMTGGLWGDTQARQGQKMVLWATLNASNYRYIIEYGFHDDGTVSFRLGSTAHNLNHQDAGFKDVHVHTGCWRIALDLGNPMQNEISIVRRLENPSDGQSKIETTVLTKEGEVAWTSHEFTILRIRNPKRMNKHQPAHAIGYDLIPQRSGSPRHYGDPRKGFTRSDFWVTRDGTDPEYQCIRLPDYIGSRPESIQGAPTVLWHHAGILHIPRDEDFGIDGDNDDGVALTAWAGFSLRPRNLFSKTPLYP